ncbi:MAG: hypothetical protein AAFO81_10635 [Pseudomonadota bacterium]
MKHSVVSRIAAFVAAWAVAAMATAGSAKNQCDTPYEEHGVYDATIVYMIDEQVTGPLFLPMDDERNTAAYRQTAYAFFAERFGLDFDVNDWGIQVISDGEGGSANVFPLKTGVGSTHQVYGVDAQRFPRWRSRMPLTKVALFDDGFFVTLDTDFRVHGTFGGDAGIVLPAGTQLVAGEYRMFDDKGRLLETFRYKSNIPVAALPVGGSFEFSGGSVFITIACDIESDLFGAGDVRSLAQITPLPDGRTDLDFRYVMRFPARLDETPDGKQRCDTLPPLKKSQRHLLADG